MYVLAWESSGGTVAYGPFRDSDAAHRWFIPKLALINPAEHRVVGYAMVAPFDHADADQTRGSGSCYHLGRESDDRAQSFIVTVVVSDAVSFGVGSFATREDAWEWFHSQRMKLHGAQGLVLPMIAPSNETVTQPSGR